jgi:general stress protein 26
MGNDGGRKIRDYLATHLYLNLATVSPDGTPLAHTVGYAPDGATVYFVTDKNSRKARNIARNPNVAYTVDEDYGDLFSIQGVQMKGRAERITDARTIEKILAMLLHKYPQMKDMPENPEYVFYKIIPLEGVFIDNTQGFGHRDTITF